MGRNRSAWTLICIIALFSCSKKDTPKTCTVSPATMTASAAGSLQYDVSTTGAATISSITYAGNSGTVTVNSPALPFEVNLNVLKGASISISVSGTAPAGTNIKAGYIFVEDSGMNPVNVQATCNQ
jgi:hypothetical protein